MNSNECRPSPDKRFFDEICNKNARIEKIKFAAYRKVSGDKCEHGVSYQEEMHIYTAQESCQHIAGWDYMGKTELFKSKEHRHKGSTKMGPGYTFLLISIALVFFVISVGAVCYIGRRELTSVT